MKSRKTMAKSLLFAMALGTLPFAGLGLNTVKAAPPAAKFNGVSGMITVDNPTNVKVVWGVAKKLRNAPKAGKVKAGQRKLGDTWYSIKSLEDAYGGEIDLNAVAKGKAVDVVLIAKAKENTVELVADDFKLFEIKAPDKNFKVVYSADGAGLDKTDGKIAGEETSGYLAFFKSNGASKKVEQFLPDGEDVQLKKGKNGKWLDLKSYFDGDAFDDTKADKRVETLTQAGSELFFRLTADSNTKWASKEVKVKVAKRPNAPKVKVDVHKDIVKLKKGMKYKVMLDATTIKAETELTDANKNTFTDLGIKSIIEASGGDVDKKQVLEIFSPRKGKKLASKSAQITLTRQAAPVRDKSIKDNLTLKNQGGAIVQDKAADNDATAKPIISLKLDTPYDPAKGAVLENTDTTKDYEFSIDWDDSTIAKKWTLLKRAKDADKPTKIKIKTSDSKKEGTFKVDKASTSKIKIRVAGDDKGSTDVVTLGSAPLVVNLKLEKLEQEIKKQSGGDNDFADVQAFEAAFNNGTEYSFKVRVKSLVNTEAKPKLLNVSKIDGVSVKADAFDGAPADTGSVSTVNIKVADKKQASIEGKKLTFEFIVEGVKQKFEITLKK